MAGFEHSNKRIDHDQVDGFWPPAHPLPLSKWADEPLRPYKFKSITDYEELTGKIQMELQQLLEEHNYDTVGNYLEFYQLFKKSTMRSAIEFFHTYKPKITPEHHNCVGLALELRHRIEQLKNFDPNIINHLCIVSCEEFIGDVDEYIALRDTFDTTPATLEKDHCLVCIKFEIIGRSGVLLCDPGYHVARVVTVMADEVYPHTSWFTQSEENNNRIEYCYSFCTANRTFVQWEEKETKNGKREDFTGIIYVERPYLTAVDVTERRNLLYPFRSLISRDQKGNLIAGVYFKVKPQNDDFTVFYQDMGKQKVKMNFSALSQKDIDEDILKKLAIANDQLRFHEGKLLSILQQCGELLKDEHYLNETLAIQNLIKAMAENN